jgi:aryl-alcohol dehydrogenase-like predicted oxidoreductase
MALPPRKIGSSLVHPIGYGAMGMSAFYGPGLSDEEAFKVSLGLYFVKWISLSFQVLDRALELGCTHLDTAAIYKDSEEVIGRWCAISYC